MQYNSDEIQKILPHRYPFLMIDRVTDCEPGKYVKARKCVTSNEMQFCGHFPGRQVMPGVLMLEALAQTGAVGLLVQDENKGKIVLLGGVRKARFRQKVVPGDVLELECEVIARRGPVGICSAKATVDGKNAVTAELSFAIMES